MLFILLSQQEVEDNMAAKQPAAGRDIFHLHDGSSQYRYFIWNHDVLEHIMEI